MENELIDKSKKFKREADGLLEESKLLDILNKYGEVKLTGSYAYDLMMCGDIDIEVFGDFTRDKAQEIFNDLISNTEFTGYMFFDWVKYEQPKWPKGYYIGFKQIMPGYQNQWKIDIWFMKENRNGSDKYFDKLSNINDKTKEIILKLKEHIKNVNWQADSTQIYDAVLDHGVKTIEESDAYLSSK